MIAHAQDLLQRIENAVGFNYFSIAELDLPESWLRDTRRALVDVKPADLKKWLQFQGSCARFGDQVVTCQAALGLLFLALFAEQGRRTAQRHEIWPSSWAFLDGLAIRSVLLTQSETDTYVPTHLLVESWMALKDQVLIRHWLDRKDSLRFVNTVWLQFGVSQHTLANPGTVTELERALSTGGPPLESWLFGQFFQLLRHEPDQHKAKTKVDEKNLGKWWPKKPGPGEGAAVAVRAGMAQNAASVGEIRQAGDEWEILLKLTCTVTATSKLHVNGRYIVQLSSPATNPPVWLKIVGLEQGLSIEIVPKAMQSGPSFSTQLNLPREMFFATSGKWLAAQPPTAHYVVSFVLGVATVQECAGVGRARTQPALNPLSIEVVSARGEDVEIRVTHRANIPIDRVTVDGCTMQLHGNVFVGKRLVSKDLRAKLQIVVAGQMVERLLPIPGAIRYHDAQSISFVLPDEEIDRSEIVGGHVQLLPREVRDLQGRGETVFCRGLPLCQVVTRGCLREADGQVVVSGVMEGIFLVLDDSGVFSQSVEKSVSTAKLAVALYVNDVFEVIGTWWSKDFFEVIAKLPLPDFLWLIRCATLPIGRFEAQVLERMQESPEIAVATLFFEADELQALPSFAGVTLQPSDDAQGNMHRFAHMARALSPVKCVPVNNHAMSARYGPSFNGSAGWYQQKMAKLLMCGPHHFIARWHGGVTQAKQFVLGLSYLVHHATLSARGNRLRILHPSILDESMPVSWNADWDKFEHADARAAWAYDKLAKMPKGMM